MSEFGVEAEQATPDAESQENPNGLLAEQEPAAVSAGQECPSETAPPAEDGAGGVEEEGGDTKKEKGASVRVAVEVAAGQEGLEEQKQCCEHVHDSAVAEGHDHDHEVRELPMHLSVLPSLCALLFYLHWPGAGSLLSNSATCQSTVMVNPVLFTSD